MITEDYVSFELAQLLKIKGFNEPCNSRFYMKTPDGKPVVYLTSIREDFNKRELINTWSRPTHQMVMKWLRDEYALFIEIAVSMDLNGDYHYSYIVLDAACQYVRKGWTSFEWKYEDAVEAAVSFCLKYRV